MGNVEEDWGGRADELAGRSNVPIHWVEAVFKQQLGDSIPGVPPIGRTKTRGAKTITGPT